MLLGIDSTDSLQGGCTTHVAWKVWARLSRFGVQGGPRLVRLNPNIPFKTRGNGAVCLELGHGRGRRRLAGIHRDTELWAYERVEPLTPAEQQEAVATAVATVDEFRMRDDPTNQPGVVAVASAPPEGDYWAAVGTLVERAPAGSGVRVGWGAGRGLIGAQAATAWRPTRGTFELIAYRAASTWGAPRRIPLEAGAAVDAVAPHSFDNWDPDHAHLRIAPRSPCPVWVGIRGRRADELAEALHAVPGEAPEGWLLFVTNQSTGDHLAASRLDDVGAYQGARFTASVADEPRSHPGGHVEVPLTDGGRTVRAWAFEPTKEFRHVVRDLRPGATVEVEASCHTDPHNLALEAVTVLERVTPPALSRGCPSCGGAGRSKGRKSGFQCRSCGERFHPGVRLAQPRPSRGTVRHTVPILVRRHLARPPGWADADLALPAGGVAG